MFLPINISATPQTSNQKAFPLSGYFSMVSKTPFLTMSIRGCVNSIKPMAHFTTPVANRSLPGSLQYDVWLICVFLQTVKVIWSCCQKDDFHPVSEQHFRRLRKSECANLTWKATIAISELLLAWNACCFRGHWLQRWNNDRFWSYKAQHWIGHWMCCLFLAS